MDQEQTVGEAIAAATAHLAAASDTARLDAELLMAHALGKDRSEVLLKAMRLSAPRDYRQLVARRFNREPLAYIVGHQEFYGLRFAVDRNVLIPRADSETLVRAALALAPPPARILDLGTGSGALLLAVLNSIPGAQGVGVDASPRALGVAQANAAELGLTDRAEFLQRDWTEDRWSESLGRFDLVLCNPPYIAEDEVLEPSVAAYEPHDALFAGKDGLFDYRLLLRDLRALLDIGGTAIFEIGHRRASAVGAIASRRGFDADVLRDLAGRDRGLILTPGRT